MKGDRNFAKELLLFDPPQVEQAGESVKILGRNPEMIAERNDHVLYRYYFYAKVHKLMWPEIRKRLSRQFYLSEVTVGEIVWDKEAETRRQQIINEGLTEKQLRNKFEFF